MNVERRFRSLFVQNKDSCGALNNMSQYSSGSRDSSDSCSVLNNDLALHQGIFALRNPHRQVLDDGNQTGLPTHENEERPRIIGVKKNVIHSFFDVFCGFYYIISYSGGLYVRSEAIKWKAK